MNMKRFEASFFQPFHLVLATIIFGIDVYLILELGQLKKVIRSNKI